MWAPIADCDGSTYSVFIFMKPLIEGTCGPREANHRGGISLDIMNIHTMNYALLLVALAAILLSPKQVLAQLPFDECSNTEAWLPMGDGLPQPNSVQLSARLNGDLYLLSVVGFYYNGNWVLSRWNGASWQKVSSFRTCPGSGAPGGDGTISDMVAYNGALYIRGAFDSVNSLPGTSALAKWDGVRWSGVEGHPLTPLVQPMKFSKMTVYRGELVVSGPFRKEDGSVNMGVHLWNGSRWLKIADDDHKSVPDDSLQITSFAEWRGDLYMGGRFATVDGVRSPGVVRWDGSRWSAVGDLRLPVAERLFTFHDRLYLVRSLSSQAVRPGDEHVMEWNGTSWRAMPGILPPVSRGDRLGQNSLYNVDVAVFDDAVYLTVARFPGRTMIRWDGTVARPCAHMNNTITFLVVHDGMLIAGGDFTSSCGGPLAKIAKLCIGSECSGISGRVVESQTGDCDRDAGVAGRIIQLDALGYAVTDDDGFYRRYTDMTGDYRVALVPARHREQTCPVAPPYRTAHIEAGGDSSAGNDFAVRIAPNVRDLQVGVVGGVARRGTAIDYVIRCTNVGTIPAAPYTLTLRHDRLLTHQRSTLGPTRIREGQLEWEMDMLRVGESRSIRVTFMVPTNKEIGSDICAVVHADDRHDACPADNTDSACTEVIASCDPNDIAVHPAGTGADGIIQSHDSVLTYTVRFQNTGNDTAFRVVVYDTLDDNLDLASLTLGPSSHPFRLHIEGRSALAWEFDDIGLPDSTQDFARSQGFFKYSVRLRHGLSANTRIVNRASIYFDYNAPVITNTVISTTSAPISIIGGDTMVHGMVELYPNPTRGMAHLQGPLVQGSPIEARDMLGRLVRSAPYDGSGDAAIDLEGLPAGVYMVSARTEAGEMAVRVTLVK